VRNRSSYCCGENSVKTSTSEPKAIAASAASGRTNLAYAIVEIPSGDTHQWAPGESLAPVQLRSAGRRATGCFRRPRLGVRG
jgi:hypothetical protein